ncbi:MAG: ROK family transcriptional regulator [Spirochaetales bacterium]|nr:ROK family transcriptional regulator [Spirochaetales bacterium]
MVNRSNELRQNNRECILREILVQEQISRQEIIEKTGLAPSTVSSIMSEILDEKIIRKSGQLSSPGTGRKTDLFSRNGSHVQILVLNLTFESNRISIVDLELKIKEEWDFEIRDYNPDAVSITLEKEIHKALNSNKLNIQSIVLALPHYPYEKDYLRETIAEKTGLRVFSINNVEAMGLYDSRYSYKLFNSLVYVFVGKGIGSAFFNKGELLMGENGYASDLGHIHITDRGFECRCGRQGCLETVSSEDALSRALMENTGGQTLLKGQELIDEIQKQIDMRNQDVQNLLSDAASYLAESFLTLISLLDPQAIILTGRITALNPFFSQKLEEYLYSKSGRRSVYANKLIYQDYRADSAVKGAALYAFLSAYGGLNK